MSLIDAWRYLGEKLNDKEINSACILRFPSLKPDIILWPESRYDRREDSTNSLFILLRIAHC